LRESLRPCLDEEGSAGYLVLDRSGTVIAARDDEEMGLRLTPAAMAINAQVFGGQTKVIKPFPLGTFSIDRPVRLDVPTIAVSTPVRDAAGTVVASWMLSDSRFTDQLKQLGLVPNRPDARAVFNVQVRDPEVDLAAGRQAALPPAARPLTRMAALAVTGEDGVGAGCRGMASAWRPKWTTTKRTRRCEFRCSPPG
jgi:hypothetical protein